MNIYDNKHIWLGISTKNHWENYIKKNIKLINIVKEELKNNFKNIQEYVLSENKDLMPLDRGEGGFCRKIIDTDKSSLMFKRDNEISQLRWYTHLDNDIYNIGWMPDPLIYFRHKYHNKINLNSPHINPHELNKLKHERVLSQKLWGFHNDGIELCNGYGNKWCKELFTDKELKNVGNSIKKYIKDKYGLTLELRIRKTP
tara:strand:+ start:357 stop:956 length:600 start_codon:yes stop_codon:yes gene_type:complete